MTTKIIFLFASAGAGVAVTLGAFAAHGLAGRVEERLIDNFYIGIEYQMYHCLALMLVAVLMRKWGSNVTLSLASCAFIFGVLLFSGGLYISTLTNMSWIALFIPVGGVCFVAGWCALFYSCYKNID